MGDGARSLRIAAVQMPSENGKIKENLERALSHVEGAVGQGAKLVLLPEFLAAGYLLSRELWDSAEPREGPTVEWLKKHSKRLKVFLGTSFLEAEGCDFFNTFVLVTPEGREAGRVRKQTPAAYEACFTKADFGPHVIDTNIGRIGVGICYENQHSYISRLMFQNSADMLLMPHSFAQITPNPLFPQKYVDAYSVLLKSLAPHYARLLGIPTVMANKCGPWVSTIPGSSSLKQESRFAGLSSIVDSDGVVKAQMEREEGVIVKDVVMDPGRKAGSIPRSRSMWEIKPLWLNNVFPVIELVGRVYYTFSRQRRAKARHVSGA